MIDLDAVDTDELLGLVGLHDPVPIKVAAKLTGVNADLIRKWKSRGRLHPAGHSLSGRPLYRPIDVLRAEAGQASGPATRGESVSP